MTSRDIIIHSAIHECYTQLFELNMCLKLVHIYTTWNSTFLLPRKSKKNGILYCKLVYDESLAENFGNDSCFSYLKNYDYTMGAQNFTYGNKKSNQYSILALSFKKLLFLFSNNMVKIKFLILVTLIVKIPQNVTYYLFQWRLPYEKIIENLILQ